MSIIIVLIIDIGCKICRLRLLQTNQSSTVIIISESGNNSIKIFNKAITSCQSPNEESRSSVKKESDKVIQIMNKSWIGIDED